MSTDPTEKRSSLSGQRPGGTLELLPGEQMGFNRMLDTIRRVYETFGFAPISTPAFEFADTLRAKGGDDAQIFYLAQSRYQASKGDSNQEGMLALKFDQTVPLARYWGEHGSQLSRPFRRYQIQPAWRAEKPQADRFREFVQCDIDVIGTDSPFVDAEIIATLDATLLAIGLTEYHIRVSNRQVLDGLLEAQGVVGDSVHAVLHALDGLDKNGTAATEAALRGIGLSEKQITALFDLIDVCGSTSTLNDLSAKAPNPTFDAGIETLALIMDSMQAFGATSERVSIDFRVVRGLDYYTGPVFEGCPPDINGSICGGGRFDDLVEVFSGQRLPSVGGSIGATRLFSKLKDTLFASGPSSPAQVLIAQRAGNDLTRRSIEVASALRGRGIATETCLGETEIRGQLGRANQLGIPWAIIIGEDELANGVLTLKNMTASDQFKNMTLNSVAAAIIASRQPQEEPHVHQSHPRHDS